MPSATRPKLKHWDGLLRGLDGLDCKVYGYTKIPLLISGKTFDVDLLVADINPDCILGMNFIRDHRAIPDFNKGEIKFDDYTVFLHHKPTQKTCRVSLVNNVTIAPLSEQIVHLRSSNKKANIPETAMITALKRFSSSTNLVLGRSLVTPTSDNHVPVVVVNTSKHSVSLPTGYDIALAHPVSCSHGSIASTQETQVNSVEEITPTTLTPQLESLVQKTDLSPSQKDKLRTIIWQHADAFASPDRPLGKTSIVEHHIDTGNEPPIRLRSRRLAAAQHDLAKTEIDKMLDKGYIEESDSPWAAPIVLVSKKDGSLRFCIDYRRLNAITRKDSYPLPNIEDTFQTLAGSKYFCALDLASSYWQVAVDEESKPKTAFITKHGLFQFNVMPFGLCNAPATFERLMERILRGHLGTRCLVYIDDVVVFGEDFDQTLANLDLVLNKIQSAGLQLKPQKCELFKTEIIYLGFKISGQGITPDTKKIECVQKWPLPCSITDVRSFVGFANYHRRFIKDFAKIAYPLTQLTKKNSTFMWNDDLQRSFDELRHALSTAPVLDHAQSDCPLILDTDASAYALGGVLSQVVDGQERVIAYASQTLSKSQKNYCTTHRELLAVVQFTKHFRHYLWGRHFLVRTDHSSLRWLMNYNDADGMVARWLTKLQEFDFTIEHRPGAKHLNADGLSRCHACKNPNCPGYRDLPKPPPPTSRRKRYHANALTVDDCPRLSSLEHTIPITKDDCPRPSRLEHTIPTDEHALFNGPVPTALALPLLTAPQKSKAIDVEHRLKELPWLDELTVEDIAAAQQVDNNIGPVYKWVDEQITPDKTELATHSEETKCLYSRRKALSIVNGVLVRQGQTSRTSHAVSYTHLRAHET